MKLSQDSSRVAVYRNEIYYLSKYLEDRNLDLANHVDDFLEWRRSDKILKRAGVDREEFFRLYEGGDDRYYELCEKILKTMSPQEKEKFIENMTEHNPGGVPAWSHMDLRVPRLPRQTWLIHFSNQSSKIVEEGFTYGVDDVERVALTTWLSASSKKYGGYNFAFIAGDKYSQQAAYSGKYGDYAVMFQSSGLEVYHYGDEENQVIYWGKAIDPRTIVELGDNDGEWFVVPRYKSSMNQKGRDYVYKGRFEDVVNWVENNWFQYKKQIMGK